MTTGEKPDDKRKSRKYSITQAIYNYRPPKKESPPKIGVGLLILIVILVCFAVYVLYKFS